MERKHPHRSTGRIKVAAIVGPTAIGKSAVALEVATRMEAEIISVDSMQVYRGMDIGTSKPGLHYRQAVPVHLVDVAGLNEMFSVARFKKLADEAVEDISERNKIPLLVGGSGLYYRAVVDDLDFAGGYGTYGMREYMEEEVGGLDDGELHALLGEVDPEAAAQIHQSNRKRVMRALEVARSGARLISERQESWKEFSSPYTLIAVGLETDRELLYRMIDERVDSMIEGGLVEEVKGLRDQGLERGTTAAEALGYRQVLDYLDGKSTLGRTAEEIKKRTRRFAKRQITWFRKDPRISWFRIAGNPGESQAGIERARKDTALVVLEYLLGNLHNQS